MTPFFLLLAAFLSAPGPEVVESLDISPVWSGHPVGFCLYTHKDVQLAAFYDADRNMTVAKRRLDAREWEFARLPEQVQWDSHNSIVMTVDDRDFIHLSGNMHVKPLVYFRTKAPLDITTFERAPMVGNGKAKLPIPSSCAAPRENCSSVTGTGAAATARKSTMSTMSTARNGAVFSTRH